MLAHRKRRWPTIETTQGQCHVFAGGAHGANDSVAIQLDEGGRGNCVYTPTPNPPSPQQLAIVVKCSAKAVYAHL